MHRRIWGEMVLDRFLFWRGRGGGVKSLAPNLCYRSL